MNLTRFTLDTYGSFTARTVTFGPGLTVVYGPNEAGKSTLRHAIGDLLWGLGPRQHPYAFEVAPSRLQVTADVDGAAGPRTLTVTGRGCRTASGELIEPWWTGGPVSSRQAWETGYGLDRDRLRDGGRAVLDNGGDLADLLFQARTGVDLGAARDQLRSEADKLWKRHRGARAVPLRAAKETVDQISDRLVDAVHAADAVAALDGDLQQARAELKEARAENARKTASKEAAQRDARAYSTAVALAGVRQDMGALMAAGDVLSETDLAHYEETIDQLTAAERDLHDVGADLETLDATPIPPPDPAVLAAADLVDELRRGEEAETDRRLRLGQLHGQIRGVLEEVRKTVADLDPALALADETRLREAAPALALPADTVDLLDRLAGQLDEAERAVDEADRQVRSAEEDLVHTQQPGERAAHGRWEAARQVRDQAWRQVREPWLAGELPGPSVRGALAEDLDNALAATDLAVGDAAAEGEQHVQLQTRAQERQHRLDTAQQERRKLADQQAILTAPWRNALSSCRLPDALDVPAWRVRRHAAETLSGLLADVAQLDADAERLASASLEFSERVTGAVSGLGIDAGDPLVALTVAHRRVSDARDADSARRERDRQRQALARKQAGAEAAQKKATQALGEFTARAPQGHVDEFVERSRRLLNLREHEKTVLGRLGAAAPDDDPDELVARLLVLTVEEVAQALGDADEEAADALDKLEKAQERRTGAARDLRAAQEDRDGAAWHQQQVDALEEMAELARRWARLQLMAGLLDRALHADSPQADATLLQHAGTLAGTLTAGRVHGLSASDASGDSRSLVIHLSGDVDAGAGDLSEGTADQVFLALRLAGIRQRQECARASGAEALPVVLDDVLMAHDDARTEAALGLLVHEARDQQIVLFTHHRAVAAAAARAGATVTELEPLPEPNIRRPVPASQQPQGHPGVDPAEVRHWARQHDFEVGERGRIPGAIVAAYLARNDPDLLVGD